MMSEFDSHTVVQNMRNKLPRNNCLFCNKECDRPENIYCNNTCQQASLWEERKHLIESTGKFVPSINGKQPRRYLLEKYGNICQICNRDEWEGKPIPLVLDHIDGNSDNWTVTNCRLICPNCDTFTPTYKSKNIGNGRWKRRQRYRDGKSF